MYIIGRVNVNATAFSFSPLSLSVIQRHDLWLVSDFQHHPSSPGFTTGLHVVNHAERLSLTLLNPLEVCFRVTLQEGNFVRSQLRGLRLGNRWGCVEPLALIVWPEIIVIKTWVKPGPGQCGPCKLRHTRWLERRPDSWTRLSPFCNVSYGCKVLSSPSESITG